MKPNIRKWVTLAVIATGAGIIFELPYLRYTFYDPLRLGLQLNHEQFGELMSFYGLLAMIFYVPSGWLADRVSHKILLTFSLIGTGLGGFYLSTWPGFLETRILFAFWGVSTVFTFWSVMLKATSLLGGKSEQGRLFSLSEGGRGIITSAVTIIATIMVASWGTSQEAFSKVIYLYSSVCIFAGILSFIFIPHNRNKEKRTSNLNIIGDTILVLKSTNTWLMIIVIFCMYTVYTTSSYFTPYMTEVAGVSVAIAALIATFKNHFTRPLSGIVGSFLSNKKGGSVPAMKISSVILAIMILIMIFLPVSKAIIILMGLVIALIGLFTFVLRGLYYAPIGELDTSPSIIGITVGLISTIAYTSDIFNFKILGKILDQNPGITGYKIIFIYMIALLILSYIALHFLQQRISKLKN